MQLHKVLVGSENISAASLLTGLWLESDSGNSPSYALDETTGAIFLRTLQRLCNDSRDTLIEAGTEFLYTRSAQSIERLVTNLPSRRL